MDMYSKTAPICIFEAMLLAVSLTFVENDGNAGSVLELMGALGKLRHMMSFARRRM